MTNFMQRLYEETERPFLPNVNDNRTYEELLHSWTNVLVKYIYCFDIDFIDEEKQNKHVYLGYCDFTDKDILLGTCVSNKAFFHFSTFYVRQYLKLFSIGLIHSNDIEIMQLNVDETTGVYRVVLKTFWLRLIQRVWKRIYKERQSILNLRMRISSQRHREIYGKYPIGLNIFPSLRGCLDSVGNRTLR